MARPIDKSTVDRLVVEHLPVALRFALRLVGDPHVAEDVVQEALCRALRRWPTYRGEASFRTWLLQIVVNVDRDRRRSQRDTRPMPTGQILSVGASPVEHAAAEELHGEIRAAIDRLPTRQREVALLSLGEGLPAREVAQILETTEANVHACLHLARKHIARAIGVDHARKETT
ncbi:MAG: sigma-70 family RNA polymerase sigma factor [Pirellulales bacterium]|nr:sigma-70 family RNA polymerase sigma factor [Pirellulales bacterium]